MMHKRRVWTVVCVHSAIDLAHKLTDMTWCCCQGFRHDGYLYLNDATGAEGAQEYAVVRERDMVQVESITFSWIYFDRALALIQQVSSGEFDGDRYGTVDRAHIQTPAEHGRCALCK